METKYNPLKNDRRVIDFGEVFTAEREVNAMLDLVNLETKRIESHFLNPACGNGNFLAEVLCLKLTTVNQQYSDNQIEYKIHAVLAISCVYGIDILGDNVQECRKRLFANY